MLKSLIIDDEEPARARLGRLLAVHPEIEVIGEGRDGPEALDAIAEMRPDLLFLDIEMPGFTGFELLRSIPKEVPLPLVIFVTGYDQHALAAFEANALGYLLKPVEAERLAQAVERACRLGSSGAERQSEQERMMRAAAAAPRVLRQIVCRKLDRTVLLPPDQVLWFQVKDGIVRAHTADSAFWVNYQLGELEVGLPEQFFRARREVLVNLGRIKEIRPYFKSGFLLVMGDAAATEIVVSERQAKSLRLRIPGL